MKFIICDDVGPVIFSIMIKFSVINIMRVSLHKFYYSSHLVSNITEFSIINLKRTFWIQLWMHQGNGMIKACRWEREEH